MPLQNGSQFSNLERRVRGWAAPILMSHSCLGMGEGSALMTQDVHPVVRYSHPADPGACARGGSRPHPTPNSVGLKLPIGRYGLLGTARTLRKRFVLSTVP